MTTIDATTVRTWARTNGFKTGDRGRLAVSVLDAYALAHAGTPTARSARTAAKGAPAGALKSAGKGKTGRTKPVTPVRRRTVPARPSAPTAAAPVAWVKPDRIVALEKQVADLTGRLAALESAKLQPGGRGTSTEGKPTRKPKLRQ